MAEVKLNAAQAEAVEQIDGPLLVLAGPGTGKTQLLSARVARILEETDTGAANILCLTFTEYGAANMLERLTSFIGQAAYEVNISTYHAFGGDLIRQHPEYFIDARLENQLDELGQHEIISQIVDKMSYQDPLKFTSISDIISTISEVKQALLTPSKLRVISKENLEFIADANPQVSQVFSDFTRMPAKLEKASSYFEKTLAIIEKLAATGSSSGHYEPLAASAAGSLKVALLEAKEINKTKPLTDWKNDWLVKNNKNEFILDGELSSQKLAALADTLDAYHQALAAGGLYDYDDMILRAIAALEANDDLRFTLQEKYQYILLDEYQDTNAAQAKLVELLTNNPASEGRPNIMAVGDDDQAIYAFQGAEASNLKDFASNYQDTKIVSLNENYRSQPQILAAATAIASQIEDRASESFKNIDKNLLSASKPENPTIIRREFLSGVAERDWVASRIEKLITAGSVRPSEIAVLAPRHKSLEPLVPFLNNLQIPVRYEKRENILESPIIKQLVTMSRLVLALAAGDEALAASYWPEVLSYEFWDIELADIWQISWTKGDNWTQKLLGTKYKWLALFFMQLASISGIETLEVMLDYLTGAQQLKIIDSSIKSATSPLKDYYTSKELEAEQPEVFYQTISHLTVLREKLRERQASEDSPLKLADFITLVDLYEASGTRMINTSPYNQAAESVQLMTVFKAKGLEFKHVFLLDCVDEVWGGKARGNSSKLTLPANLASIRRTGTTNDERLRVFFVALTRAKLGLYLLSATSNYSGKATTRLKFLDEQVQADGSFKALMLPPDYQQVITSKNEVPELATLELNWQNRHIDALANTDLKALLTRQLENYQLSPTHLNTFIDLERGGPRSFLLNTLLKFPQAQSSSAAYGDAIHKTLEWYQYQIDRQAKPPASRIEAELKNQLLAKKLASDEFSLRLEQGKFELAKYLASSNFKPGDRAEEKFKKLGVFIGEAHLNGKIDRLEIDQTTKSLIIVDYKTGNPSEKWKNELKFHKYKQQLYIYKMLIESASAWRGWTVTAERLDFIKPNPGGEIISLPLTFNQKEFDQTKALIGAMWQHVMNLDFPDVSGYSKDYAGTRQFEQDLINGNI